MLMLILSGVLFVAGYGIYALFLGAVDGLPVLPRPWLPVEPHNDPALPPGEREKLIEQAFGKGCDELNRPVKLLLRDKGLILAAGQFTIEPDGRVKFSPFSAALFPKNKEPGPPEINTVRSDFAYFTLDNPVHFPFELADRKVMVVELRGKQGVTITNNRRTAQKNDDLEIHVAISPLFYEEQRHLIWTDGFVQLHDYQSQPKPPETRGRGMKTHLAADPGVNPAKPANAPAKPKNEGIGNVELIELLSSVEMHLYVDASDGFLGGPDAAQTPKPVAGQPVQKDHVFIRTAGTFTYDPNKELAIFDGPAKSRGGLLGNHPEQVLVSRKLREEKFDQLVSNHLKVHFRKKASPPAGAPPPQPGLGGGDKEIEKGIRTVEPGQKVTLTMDSPNLEADGTELQYHCAVPGTGPRTVLTGSPMRAVKDGHKIQAPLLDLTGADKAGNGQRGFAQRSEERRVGKECRSRW